ncbi:hypothetical protein WDU94_012440 [Cyamophila willieti]
MFHINIQQKWTKITTAVTITTPVFPIRIQKKWVKITAVTIILHVNIQQKWSKITAAVAITTPILSVNIRQKWAKITAVAITAPIMSRVQFKYGRRRLHLTNQLHLSTAIFANDTNNGNEQEIFVEFLVKLSLIESQTNISVHEFNAIRTCIMSDEKLAKLVDKFGFACRCIKSDKRFNTILNNLRYNTDNYGMWVQMLEAMQTTNLSSILNTKIYTSGNDDSYSQRSAAPVPIGAASSSRTKKQQLLTGFAKSNGKKTPQQPRQRGRCVGRNNVGDSSSSLVEIVFKPKTKWDTIVGGQNMSPKIISNSTTLDDLCKLALMNCEPMLRARCMEKVSSTPYVKFLNKIAASNSYISEDVICAIVCMRMLCNVKSSDLWPTGLENIIFGQVSEEGGLKLCPTLKYAFHMKRPFVILAEWSSQVVTTTKRTKKNTQEVDTDNLREKWETDGVAFLNFDRMLPPMTSSFGDLVSEEMGGYYANNTRLILFLIVVLVEILHWTASVHNSMQLMHPAIMVHISLPRRCKFL